MIMTLTKRQIEILRQMANGDFLLFDHRRKIYLLSDSRETVKRPTLRTLRRAGLMGGSRITEKGKAAITDHVRRQENLQEQGDRVKGNSRPPV